MNYQQIELCQEAREGLDHATDALQDLAADLAAEARDDQPVLDSIIADLLMLKHQIQAAERNDRFQSMVPPTQRGLGLPEGDA